MRDRPLQLMLVDEDPRFRLGLKVWLEQQGDFAVVAEAGTAEAALKSIRSHFLRYEKSKADSAIASDNRNRQPRRSWRKKPQNQPVKASPRPPIDLVLLDLGMGADGLDNHPGLQLCQQIKSEFPMLPVLVLSAEAEPNLQAAAKRAGASAYGTRSMSVRLLAQKIVQAAAVPYAPTENAPTEDVPTEAQPTPETSQTSQPARPIDPTVESADSAADRVADSAIAPSPSPNPPTSPSAAQASKPQISTPQISTPQISTPQTSTPANSVNPSAFNPSAANPSAANPSDRHPGRLSDRLDARSGTQTTPPAAAGRRQKSSTLSRLEDIPGPLTAMRISMRLSGLQQIDRNLAAVNAAKRQTTSWLNQAILDGKKRELTAARWLVSSIWRTPQFSDRTSDRRSAQTARASDASSRRESASTDWIRIAQQGGYGSNYADMTAARYLDREALVANAAAILAATEARLQARPSEVQNVVFEGVFAKLQRPLKNTTQSPLEIDILRADKKLELLYLVLRQLEELLADLRESNVQPGQLSVRSSQVLRDLWDVVNTEFFGKYYTVRVGNVEEEVITLLQQEKPLVEAQILNKIPMASELFGHWLFQEPMEIDGRACGATTPEAIARSERLLENLVIQVANAVVQPLLNRLSDTESIKKSLYTSRLMSTREIERFRNDLSWRYRKDRIVDEPQAIFESRYNLFVLGFNGIEKTSIYAPRRAELDRLKGLPLMVTLALETRDAIAPRLRTAFSLVGSSVVYVLTEVLGRGIGLVGRGVLKGVGNIRQEGKARQKKRQPEYAEPYRKRDQDNNYRASTYQDEPYVEDPYSQEFNEWE